MDLEFRNFTLEPFQDPSRGPPKGMAEALGFDSDHLEVLRLEMPLLLLNFIREQSSKTLQVMKGSKAESLKINSYRSANQ